MNQRDRLVQYFQNHYSFDPFSQFTQTLKIVIFFKILSSDYILLTCLYTTIRTDRQHHINIRNILH